MVIDHVGLFFFPHIVIMRVIGRLAFPLFAWLIANGAHYTHNIKVYILRLLALAVVTQVPFWYVNQLVGSPALYFDVVFTLVLGLTAIMVIQNVSNRWLWLTTTLCCAVLAVICNTDYGAAGVLSVVAFYVFRNDFRAMVFSQTVILGILPMFIYQLQSHFVIDLSYLYDSSFLEFFGLLSLFIIYSYNNKRGIPAKYLFYIFYFLQYVTILAVKLALG